MCLEKREKTERDEEQNGLLEDVANGHCLGLRVRQKLAEMQSSALHAVEDTSFARGWWGGCIRGFWCWSPPHPQMVQEAKNSFMGSGRSQGWYVSSGKQQPFLTEPLCMLSPRVPCSDPTNALSAVYSIWGNVVFWCTAVLAPRLSPQ